MKTINWSICSFNNKVAVLALLSIDDKYAINVHEFPLKIETFDTIEQAISYITQTQKPFYYQLFGAGYELNYLKNDSDEWLALMEKWENSYKEIVDMITPWYVKIWGKIKGAFKSSL